MEPLGNFVINDYRKDDEDYNIQSCGFLQNLMTNETEKKLYYNKVGLFYFIQGEVNFSSLELDILPEEALVDGFLFASNGEMIDITEGSTILTAPSTGIKTVSGFYTSAIQD